MKKLHHYSISNRWEGNSGNGTSGPRNYERSHRITIDGKPELELTTDNPLVGDKRKLNPEDLLVTALSSCHLMSYLYLCSLEGVVVLGYEDKAEGIMLETEAGGGSFQKVKLKPVIELADATMIDRAKELHHKAHEICYIANSINFPVEVEAIYFVGDLLATKI